MSKSERLQVLVEPQDLERLRREAHRRGVSVAEVVRVAVERELGDRRKRRLDAFERLIALPRFPVPDDPAELDREINEMYHPS
jgi:hypothetical protein